MPANYKAVLAFRARDGGDYRRIAAGIGENTVRFIDGMLKSGPIEEQCKRKTSCVFSSDNPSFIMITYILLYFSCRTGSAFD